MWESLREEQLWVTLVRICCFVCLGELEVFNATDSVMDSNQPVCQIYSIIYNLVFDYIWAETVTISNMCNIVGGKFIYLFIYFADGIQFGYTTAMQLKNHFSKSSTGFWKKMTGKIFVYWKQCIIILYVNTNKFYDAQWQSVCIYGQNKVYIWTFQYYSIWFILIGSLFGF